MNKVVRIQISKPLDLDWKEFSKLLYDLRYETWKCYNRAIQLCWEYDRFASSYKQNNGVSPKDKDILGYTLDGYCYNILSKEFTKLSTYNISISIRSAIKRWKTDLKDVHNGNKSIASYKRNLPLDLHNKAINLSQTDEGYILSLALISNIYKKELDHTTVQYKAVLKVRDNSQIQILNRILSGEYKIAASKLVERKGKWFVNLVYAFDNKILSLDPNNILGVDMGIIFPVYMAFNNSLNRYKIEGGEIEQFRKQVEKRRNQLLHQGKYCGNGRKGHGILTRTKPIEFAQHKIANFRDTVNHRYSKYIIDMAIKHGCGTIQVEDLTGISTNNTFLKNWPYYDLQEKIRYKAEEVGIVFKRIEPKYTSQRCSQCGCIHKENRPDQSTFKCIECGYETNADFNAARNIATPDIDHIIALSIKVK